ncbi:MAG: O-antigen ligase family protein [Candidatus Sulfotelmatobacter sp.]
MATQTPVTRSAERTRVWRVQPKTAYEGRRRFIFSALVVFCVLYYYRPEDFSSLLAHIPMARISGGIAFIALLTGLSGSHAKIPRAVKILWLLLLQMAICIPSAVWVGGATHTVFDRFAKGVVVAMLLSMVVVTVREIRKLLWIQVSAVSLVTFFSIALRHYGPDGRLIGIQNGILSNPNDLAANIAMSFPIGLAFLLYDRGFKKAIWGLALAVMSIGVVLTGSRSGLLALIISIIVCVWQYGIQGKRRKLVVATIVVFVMGFGLAISNAHYRARVESIVMGRVEGEGENAAASIEARKELLRESVMMALHHPMFGVGPGCFILIDPGWRVAHNSYTELAAESGIPALVLFLLALWAAFKNLTQIRKSRQYRDDPEFTLFAQAIWAGLAAYMAGAFFASIEYNLYPYFVIGYTCAMVRISSQPIPDHEQSRKPQILGRATYAGIFKPQTARTR